jgi:hypothetical protein
MRFQPYRVRRTARNFLLAQAAAFLLIFFLVPNHSAPIGDQVFLSVMIAVPLGFFGWIAMGLVKFATGR